MNVSEFIAMATKGDEAEARAALEQAPGLAAARDQNGVSVIGLAVYSGRAGLAAEIAASRSDLDIFEAPCVGDAERALALVGGEPELVNAVSPDGFSPLGFSAFFGHADLLVSLIGLGADVDTPARNGLKVRPLHSAVANSDPDKASAMARSLLAAGAAPNAKQQGGFTPLQAAALHGNLDLVRLLLENGADPGLVNESGATAVDLAESGGHSEVARLLRSS